MSEMSNYCRGTIIRLHYYEIVMIVDNGFVATLKLKSNLWHCRFSQMQT